MCAFDDTLDKSERFRAILRPTKASPVWCRWKARAQARPDALFLLAQVDPRPWPRPWAGCALFFRSPTSPPIPHCPPGDQDLHTDPQILPSWAARSTFPEGLLTCSRCRNYSSGSWDNPTSHGHSRPRVLVLESPRSSHCPGQVTGKMARASMTSVVSTGSTGDTSVGHTSCGHSLADPLCPAISLQLFFLGSVRQRERVSNPAV